MSAMFDSPASFNAILMLRGRNAARASPALSSPWRVRLLMASAMAAGNAGLSPCTTISRSLGFAPLASTRNPASASSARLFSVAMTAEACSMPGNLPSIADSCIRETESRYSRGTIFIIKDDMLILRCSDERARAKLAAQSLRRRCSKPCQARRITEQQPAHCIGARAMTDLQSAHGRLNNIARMRYGVDELDQAFGKPTLHGIAQHLAADRIGLREKWRERNIQPFQ